MFKKLFILSALSILSAFSYAGNDTFNSFDGHYVATQGVFNFDATKSPTATTATNSIPNDLKHFTFTIFKKKNTTIDYFIISFYSQFGSTPDAKVFLRPTMMFLTNFKKFKNSEIQVTNNTLPDNMTIALNGNKLLVSVSPHEFQVKYFRGNPPVNLMNHDYRKFNIKAVFKSLNAPKKDDIIG